jgi:hypothetical protein
MRECRYCGAHVTQRFARVFGDNENEIHGCPNCLDVNELYDGVAALSDPGVAE